MEFRTCWVRVGIAVALLLSCALLMDFLLSSVLSAFAMGVAVGVLGMVPRWWKQRHPKVQGTAAANNSVDARDAQLLPTHGL